MIHVKYAYKMPGRLLVALSTLGVLGYPKVCHLTWGVNHGPYPVEEDIEAHKSKWLHFVMPSLLFSLLQCFPASALQGMVAGDHHRIFLRIIYCVDYINQKMPTWSSNPWNFPLSKENIPASCLTELPLSEHVLNMLKLEVNTLVYSTYIVREWSTLAS